jgi:hypothetical protein
MLLTGTLILHRYMRTMFLDKDSERRKFLLVFMIITAIVSLQSLFYLSYAQFRVKVPIFIRYNIENWVNVLWDCPIILIMSWHHY